MNFKIQEENTNTKYDIIVSPCQLLHKKNTHNHNTTFEIYIKQKHGSYTDINKNYSDLQKDGVKLVFNIFNKEFYLINYNVFVKFRTSKMSIPDQCKSCIMVSLNNKYDNILHKINIVQEKKYQKRNDITVYNVLKNFSYFYLNVKSIYNIDNIKLFLSHDIFKDIFYNAGCMCVLFNHNDFQNQEQINGINLIYFIAKIMEIKMKYYDKSSLSIKLVIDDNINELIYSFAKSCTEIKEIYKKMKLLIEIQEQYLYLDCDNNNINYELLDEFIYDIELLQNHINKDNMYFPITIILLITFLKSNDFKMMHKEYKEYIFNKIKNSNISKFLNLNENNNNSNSVFIYVTIGELDILNTEKYDLFDIFTFLKDKSANDLFI